MNKTFSIGFALLFCSTLPAADFSPLDVKTGQWESTVTGQVTGMPPIPEEALNRMTPEQRAQRSAERFAKSDKNSDGFLTQDEVGAKRWERIQVADANKDGKVTKAELDQARQEGKIRMGHRHEKKTQS